MSEPKTIKVGIIGGRLMGRETPQAEFFGQTTDSLASSVHLHPSFLAAAAVVPLPQKKSATESPSLLHGKNGGRLVVAGPINLPVGRRRGPPRIA